jgi:hypothetical protein
MSYKKPSGSPPLEDPPCTQTDGKSTLFQIYGKGVRNLINTPLVRLFSLGIGLLQLIFALAVGISYAIELSKGNVGPIFVYSQVVFAPTLAMLIVDAVTMCSYLFVFHAELALCILWLVLFGLSDPEYLPRDTQRMKTAVWLDLVNCLLWSASIVFSSAMWCSGTNVVTKGELKMRRMPKQRRDMQVMEEGIVRETAQSVSEDRLTS